MVISLVLKVDSGDWLLKFRLVVSVKLSSKARSLSLGRIHLLVDERSRRIRVKYEYFLYDEVGFRPWSLGEWKTSTS
jgi:hypothetical protein